MFYFDSNTTIPLQCDPLVVFWKAYVDRMSSGSLFLGIPICFGLSQTLIKLIVLMKLIASASINVFRYF